MAVQFFASASQGLRHYHLDHLGSPRLVTNRCGQRVALLDHNPWGLDRPTGVQDGERHRFTAHQRDLGQLDRTWDDFDHMHARYYNPNIARFLSTDPVTEVGKTMRQPQRWNRYAYAVNNPIVYTDPTGETVYLVTYTTGNSSGDDEFKRAAYTRAIELRKAKGFDPNKDRVLVRGVATKQDLVGALKEAASLEKTFGKIGEFSLFSHAGPDRGPTFQYGTSQEHQFLRSDLGTFSGNWETGGSARFYGCNTGISFSQAFADAQGITTYGYTGPALFSSTPGRFTLPQETGPLYLIQTEGGFIRTLLGLTSDAAIPMKASTP